MFSKCLQNVRILYHSPTLLTKKIKIITGVSEKVGDSRGSREGVAYV
jgi:hypothetical protein